VSPPLAPAGPLDFLPRRHGRLPWPTPSVALSARLAPLNALRTDLKKTYAAVTGRAGRGALEPLDFQLGKAARGRLALESRDLDLGGGVFLCVYFFTGTNMMLVGVSMAVFAVQLAYTALFPRSVCTSGVYCRFALRSWHWALLLWN
jgi:hypothetical protein